MGGGSDYSALFNGRVVNGTGAEATENDGRTFVGFGEGDTLTVTFDAAAARTVSSQRGGPPGPVLSATAPSA